ncbi:MAG: glycosyltransferase [Porphyrobacter sp.]|nr:glycosyltransferase [Porphyrobacter sp.]
MARVTISIVSHGHRTMVEALLGDLARQTLAPALEVVLTLNVAEAPPRLSCWHGLSLRIIRNDTPRGFGANHNSALLGVETPWVIVMNPDIRIKDDTLLERLVGRKSQDRLGVITPRIENSHGQLEDAVRLNLDPISLLGRRVFQRTKLAGPALPDGRFRWIAGMFMALPSTAWKSVNGFDERYFLYCEDYDLCARLATQGYSIVVDDKLSAIHDAQRSSHRSLKYLRWHVTSILKVWSRPHFWQIWALDLLCWWHRLSSRQPVKIKDSHSNSRESDHNNNSLETDL